MRWPLIRRPPRHGYGQGEHEGRALPCEGLGPHPPAVGLGEAPRDRKAEPGTLDIAQRSALEGREDPLDLLGREAGAVIDDPHQGLSRRRADDDVRGVVGRVLDGVLDQVGQHPLDLIRVDPDDGGDRRQRHLDAVSGMPEAAQRLDDEAVGSPDLGLGHRGAGLQAREVEQVRDQAVEPPRLAEDAVEQICSIGLVQAEVRPGEGGRRRQDRHQRRA